jgi:hypothetical protein
MIKTDARNTLLTLLKEYEGDSFVYGAISVEMLDSIIVNMKKGKAAGLDNLTIEHLQFAHPVVCCILSKLFNLMVMFNYVPIEFGKGVIIPIPKGEGKQACNKSDNYRGITLSPVLSKVFENCLVTFLRKYLVSSERQLGFKKGVGCNNAIFSVRKVVDYFVSNNSTVNICTVDLTKAFDRLSHDILFVKLMDRRVPRCILETIKNWYDKMCCKVKWGNSLSAMFVIKAGVHQGGILSPSLFSIYVDDILVKLEKSKMGCFIKNVCTNSYMYADDLLLLSISLKDMQSLVDLCESEFNKIGMAINNKKTSCLRIGKRHNVIVQPILVDGLVIPWKQELKYLGVTITSARHFKTNNQAVKQKFFRAVNGIFGKIGLKSSAELICSLISSHCIPILMYASEVLTWSLKDLRSMSFAYDQPFNKIFKSFDKKVIRSCQYYLHILPFNRLLELRRLNFLANENNSVRFDKTDNMNTIRVLMKGYNITKDGTKQFAWKNYVWLDFQAEIDSM